MEHLKCPLCATSLSTTDRQWKCNNGHCFDVAKEGYVNLLPVQKKRSKTPGDSKAMLQARRGFLSNGHYQFLADEMLKLIPAQQPGSGASVLDLGCGEGYYLSCLVDTLPAPCVYDFHALDIAKDAVRMTAKRKTGAICAVGSAYETPYFDDTFSVIYSVFSPYSLTEILRISKPGAIVIIVGPGSEHLKELAKHVYDEVKPHSGNRAQIQETISGFNSSEPIEISRCITIKQAEIENLLAMTPYYWSINEEKKQRLIALTELTVTLHFEVQVLHVAETTVM